MMKLFFVILLVSALGVAIGGAGGYYTRHISEDGPDEIIRSRNDNKATGHTEAGSTTSNSDKSYYNIQSQFIIPVIHQGSMDAIVVVGLALETSDDIADIIFKKEPKLRDAFLRIMFDHANIGGFDGNFIENGPMQLLEDSLLAVARKIINDNVTDILIQEIGRQEID